MAKKPEKKPKAQKSPKDATSGIQTRLKDPAATPAWEPNSTERAVGRYIKRRIGEMQDYRKSLNLEPRWKQADEEYVPHELDFGTTRKRFETDQDTGLRSRMVPVGDTTQQWRQASSAPTLLAKIQTAVSIIVDQQPEAELVALLKKYTATTELAYALWKRNWQITDAKEKLKLVIFNLIKYGWAPQRTYPRLIRYPKRVLSQKDPENPENDKYTESEIEWFNDVDREPLNPFRTWIDEMTKPYDPFSMNECYYEVDYSYDSFMVEFGKYANSKFVPPDSAMQRAEESAADSNRQTVSRSQSVANQSKIRKDIVTVGFFESRTKDMFAIYIPKSNMTVYQSPLPNDDGYLSLTHTLWILRSANLPYGISLWEVIRQNKALYDKMKNMTMDQLVLSIMKFGFFAGSSTALGDGKIQIVPGEARQLTSSTGKPEVDWMEIPGPGAEAWKGIEAVASMMDDESGISPTLEGDVTGKTLGEILHAKEASLKRLKVPVDNIAWLIEQDAYLTLSWMSQVYAVPNVVDFTDEMEMLAYEQENQITHEELFAQTDEDGGMVGIRATYLPQLSLHLEDRDGQLYQSRESRFFQVGKDIKPNQLKWRGIFKIIPRSIVDSSQELVKAAKMEMFNMLVPLLQFPPQLVAKAVQQILKVNEEDASDWLPDTWVQYLNQANGAELPNVGAPGAEGAPAGSGGAPQSPPGAPAAPGGAGGGPVMPNPGGPTIQGATGLTPPQAATIVPGGPGPDISQLMGGKAKGLFGRGL